MSNIRGEITVLNVKEAKSQLSDKDELGHKDEAGELQLMTAVAESLNLQTSAEIKGIKDVLFPSIICSAVYKGDLKTMEELEKRGAGVTGADYDMRTPLHVAASEGNVEVVAHLLRRGASVHARLVGTVL